jgi:hypothetical protein
MYKNKFFAKSLEVCSQTLKKQDGLLQLVTQSTMMEVVKCAITKIIITI